MNHNASDKATDPTIQKHCEFCRWMRKRQPTDVKVEAGHDLDTHWCSKINSPTIPTACRCGGDDWESIPTEQERRDSAANLNHEMFEYKKRHGAFHATQWLIEQLVKLQREDKFSRAEYQGDDFKVVVTTKKQK